MFDGPLMSGVNLLVVDTILLKSTKFVMGVKINTTGELKLDDSPDLFNLLSTLTFVAASRQHVPVVHQGFSPGASTLVSKFQFNLDKELGPA